MSVYQVEAGGACRAFPGLMPESPRPCGRGSGCCRNGGGRCGCDMTHCPINGTVSVCDSAARCCGLRPRARREGSGRCALAGRRVPGLGQASPGTGDTDRSGHASGRPRRGPSGARARAASPCRCASAGTKRSARASRGRGVPAPRPVPLGLCGRPAAAGFPVGARARPPSRGASPARSPGPAGASGRLCSGLLRCAPLPLRGPPSRRPRPLRASRCVAWVASLRGARCGGPARCAPSRCARRPRSLRPPSLASPRAPLPAASRRGPGLRPLSGLASSGPPAGGGAVAAAAPPPLFRAARAPGAGVAGVFRALRGAGKAAPCTCGARALRPRSRLRRSPRCARGPLGPSLRSPALLGLSSRLPRRAASLRGASQAPSRARVAQKERAIKSARFCIEMQENAYFHPLKVRITTI